VALISGEIVPHDANLAMVAIYAFQHYGKGIHPQARLNFCDSAAYTLAKNTNTPVLFKGQDFIHADKRHVFRIANGRQWGVIRGGPKWSPK
jgi:ribonuclease VapC